MAERSKCEWYYYYVDIVVGPFSVISAFLPLLRQSNGRILNVSSFAGQTSTPMNGIYAASKIALENATDTLRNEVYPFGISVSLIIPGAVDITSKYASLIEGDASSPTALTNSRSSLEKTAAIIDREVANNRMSSSVVTRSVDHALSSEYPKARYLVGLDSKLTRWLKWSCSDRLLDWVRSVNNLRDFKRSYINLKNKQRKGKEQGWRFKNKFQRYRE